MTKAFIHKRIRRIHRWLGVILGIQFLFWTVGGLYFSWSDMDEIHGDHDKAHVHPLAANLNLVSPQTIIDKIKLNDSINFIHDTRLVQILNEPFFQVTYSKDHMSAKKIQLANAKTGDLSLPLIQEEAVLVAKQSFNKDMAVKTVEYITNTNGHHEYREQPLPAYAVTFNSPGSMTVYVSSELGTAQKFRNNKWRIFDFLWMMHTMDYKSRDNLSNWLLRAFSIFGLLTITSGFILFFVSLKKKSRVVA
jgi:hypothetical protein